MKKLKKMNNTTALLDVIFRNYLKMILVFFLLGDSAYSNELNESSVQIKPGYDSFRCLKDQSVSEMANIYLDLFFASGESEKKSSQPLVLWKNEFSGYRARGLYEEFGNASWNNYQADLNYLNRALLRIVQQVAPEYLSVEKILKVTFFSKHIDLSSTKLKNYRPLSEFDQKKMEIFQAGNEFCESWHGVWTYQDIRRDRLNILVSVDTPQSTGERNRISVASCFVRSSFKEMGFENIDYLENAELLVKHPKSVVEYTELAKWLFWVRFELEQRGFDLTSRQKLNVNVKEILETECNQ